MFNAEHSVYIVTTREQALKRLGRLDVLKNIPEENIIVGRLAALEHISAKQSKRQQQNYDGNESLSNV